MIPPPELATLAALSAELGREPTLVQGAGGNTSLKAAGVLWVKASGKWLAAAERERVFTAVAIDACLSALARGEESFAPLDGHSGLRPSIETPLHALMPHRVVLHVHSIATLAWAVRQDAAARLAERLQGLAWALVPYRRPGLPLAQAVAEACRQGAPDILVLQNHGLVVGGEDCAEAAARLAAVEARLAVAERPGPAVDGTALSAAAAAAGLVPPSDPELHRLATDPDSLRFALGGVPYPDHAVFLGPRFLVAGTWSQPTPPPYLAWPGVGMAVHPRLGAGAVAMLSALAQLAGRLDPAAPLRYLDDGEVAELGDWEAERYRRALDDGGT